MAVLVPDSPTNGAITELGFAAGQGDTKRSKAGLFFLQDVRFGGNFGLFENEIKATAAFGPLALTAEATGTVDEPTGKFFGADVSFELVNPVDSTGRITVNQIIEAIKDKKFFFQPGEAGGTLDDPATGFIDGVVSGGLGLTLGLKPDGLFSGLPVTLGSVSIDAQSPNWLVSPPLLSNPFAFPDANQSLAAPGASVNLAGLASSAGVLSKDMVFILSQTIDGQTFATPVVVKAADTAGNLGNADLETDIQAAVDLAIARIQRLADEASCPSCPGHRRTRPRRWTSPWPAARPRSRPCRPTTPRPSTCAACSWTSTSRSRPGSRSCSTRSRT